MSGRRSRSRYHGQLIRSGAEECVPRAPKINDTQAAAATGNPKPYYKTTMFRKLQRSRNLHQDRKPPLRAKLEASMPLELLYKIVDDHWQELTQDNGRGLRALAATCRALAAYCRPLLFHSITLYALDAPIPRTSWSGPITQSEQFSRLVRIYPSSASLVKELRVVVIKPHPSSKERALKRIGIDAQRNEMKPWRSLLKESYPALTTLRVIVSWSYVSPLLTNAFLEAIKRMPTLETLELEGDGLPLQRVLQSLPPTLKHFSLLGGQFFNRRPSEWNLPPNPVPTLDSLTLSIYLHPAWLSCVLFSPSPPFHLESLTHLQTRPFRLIDGIMRLHSTPSNTLQCLHIYLDYFAFDPDLLNIAHLRVLTHLEVIREGVWHEWRDFQALDWLERSMQTLGAISSPEVIKRLSTLTICFLHLDADTLRVWDELYRIQLAQWESSFRFSELRYIELTNIVGFATAICRPSRSFPGYFVEVDTPQSLPTIGDVPVSSYESVWKSCGCMGWRCW
ncbi:hypothetical protein BKA70DRAFT_1406699 [Coprinopsis sp. MPI-PUGE-AT-0042]|nr:hypothetical protein BKA70DRAFT_1406699 [Coprinopsis sp. MPI-PUGE-AT-0042]